MSRARDLANLGNNAGGLETLTVSDITDLTVNASNINSATNQIIDSSTDLNIDSNTLVVDKSADTVVIGGTSGTEKLTVNGATVVAGQLQSHQTSSMALHQDSTTLSEIRVYGADASTSGKFRIRGYANDGSPFYKGIAIDNAGNVALGIDDPEKLLHLNHSTSSTIKFTNSTTGTGATAGIDIDVTGTSMTITNHEDGQFVLERANGTDLFRVTTSAIDGIHINSRVVYSSGDADTIFTPGMYRLDPNVGNIPSGHHYAMVVFGNGSNVTTQIAVKIASTLAYVRSYNTSWTSWSNFN